MQLISSAARDRDLHLAAEFIEQNPAELERLRAEAIARSDAERAALGKVIADALPQLEAAVGGAEQALTVEIVEAARIRDEASVQAAKVIRARQALAGAEARLDALGLQRRQLYERAPACLERTRLTLKAMHNALSGHVAIGERNWSGLVPTPSANGGFEYTDHSKASQAVPCWRWLQEQQRVVEELKYGDSPAAELEQTCSRIIAEGVERCAPVHDVSPEVRRMAKV